MTDTKLHILLRQLILQISACYPVDTNVSKNSTYKILVQHNVHEIWNNIPYCMYCT